MCDCNGHAPLKEELYESGSEHISLCKIHQMIIDEIQNDTITCNGHAPLQDELYESGSGTFLSLQTSSDDHR